MLGVLCRLATELHVQCDNQCLSYGLSFDVGGAGDVCGSWYGFRTSIRRPKPAGQSEQNIK